MVRQRAPAANFVSGDTPTCFFAPEEYRARWARVDQAMAAGGYDHLLIWQRGAGTFDRVGDVFWLTNFVMNGSGQDPASEEYGAPYTFSAVLIRRGREPELHVGLPAADMELTHVVCGTVVSHPDNLITGLARYLRTQGIEGRVAVVGDDVLPGMYDRLLRLHTPQIDWHADETLLLGAQTVKSSRELEAYRMAGELVTRSLTSACEALLVGESSAEAASRAAAILLRAGGGFHRIDIHHGPATEHRVVSADLYGYQTTPPAAGEVVRDLDLWAHLPGLLAGSRPIAHLRQSAQPRPTGIAGRGGRSGGRLGGGNAAWGYAKAAGRTRRGACSQARLLRSSAVEGAAFRAWIGDEFHAQSHSHRWRRSGSHGTSSLRRATQSGHGDGGRDFSDASWHRDRRLRTKSHRH